MKTNDKFELWLIVLVWFLMFDICLLVGVTVWDSLFAGFIIFFVILGVMFVLAFFCLVIICWAFAKQAEKENEY